MALTLTTAERLANLWSGSAGQNAREDQILQVIPAVSRAIEKYLEVDGLELRERTDYFNVIAGQNYFALRTIGIVSITSIRSSQLRDWTVDPIDPQYYTFDPARGILEFDGYYLETGPRTLQVIYEGGIAEDVDDLAATDEYADIMLAAEQQVLFTVTRSPHFGSSSLSVGGGSRSFETPVTLLKDVTDKLDKYKRPFSS
jgi:hypothetical protein